MPPFVSPSPSRHTPLCRSPCKRAFLHGLNCTPTLQVSSCLPRSQGEIASSEGTNEQFLKGSGWLPNSVLIQGEPPPSPVLSATLPRLPTQTPHWFSNCSMSTSWGRSWQDLPSEPLPLCTLGAQGPSQEAKATSKSRRGSWTRPAAGSHLTRRQRGDKNHNRTNRLRKQCVNQPRPAASPDECTTPSITYTPAARCLQGHLSSAVLAVVSG